MKISYGQQCVLDLLRDGWELRHLSMGTKPGWYVVMNVVESIDISNSTGNALARKKLITKVRTEGPITTWKET